MRLLTKDETAQEGDWFFVFLIGVGWIRLGPEPKPFFRKTIGELDAENKSPHFPILIMRPNPVEYLFKTEPKYFPSNTECPIGRVRWLNCNHCNEISEEE